MAQNALAAMARQRWDFDVPDVKNALAPIMQGWESGIQDQQRGIENQRQNKLMQFRENAENRAQRTAAREDDDAKVQRMGREASAIMNIPEAQRSQVWNSWIQRNPDVAAHAQKSGVDLSDYRNGPQFIATQAGQYDAEKRRAADADIGVKNAQRGYYEARTRNELSPPTPAPVAPAPPDRLAGAGLDDDGNIVTAGAGNGSRGFAVPDYVPTTGSTMQPPMRLGGPLDDIDRSMLPDEGRGARPQGVQVAQAGGPSIVDTARMSPFGPAGRTSPEIPGVVTDAGRNRRVDVPATREMQGQRAYDAASPDQQQRLMKFRQDQEMWTGVYKRQPRAGYYYGEDGREMPLTDKNFKGDRESQAVALMNMNKVEEASKKLLDYNWASRSALGALNVGEVGQAFADMKQGALGIAYALSGKTVAVAEMKNFIEAYGPVPGDGAERIQNKTQRMRDFYQALLTASRGGESYEKAFARAMASTGLKNPDGGPAGAPAVAGSTSMPPPGNPGAGLSGVSTEELVRRLSGGR